jgi:hypothetical protein
MFGQLLAFSMFQGLGLTEAWVFLSAARFARIAATIL